VGVGEEVDARKMASLIIEILASEEVKVVNEPRGRLLKALLEVARWMGIKVSEA